MGFGAWKRQSCLKGTGNCDSNVMGIYCCRPPFVAIYTYIHLLLHIYRNTVSWASFQTHRMRTSKSGPGFLSNILFLVVLLPGQAWEPLLKAIFHMRQIRPEKCLP